MFAFSVSHQQDFVAVAERQRRIVTSLAQAHPMMDRHATFVLQLPLIAPQGWPSIEYQDSHSYYYLLVDLWNFGHAREDGGGPIIRLVPDYGWQKRVTLRPDGAVDLGIAAWPAQPEMPGHIWIYALGLDGTLTPLTEPLIAGGRNVLHEGPDAGDDLVDLRALPRWPLFDLLMGPDAPSLDPAAFPKAEPDVSAP
jgi:hypothetical protein